MTAPGPAVRILVIGDVHGHPVALDAVLNAAAPGPDDRIVLLGDYVDGGPDTAGALTRVSELVRTRGAVALRGNHDEVMSNALAFGDEASVAAWMAMSGGDALASYADPRLPGAAATIDDVPMSHVKLLQDLRLYYDTPSYIFVHGGVQPTLPMEEQPAETLLWQKATLAEPHVSRKLVVCGHTRQTSGVPLDLGHTLCIDTNIKAGGVLTCVELFECVRTDPVADGRSAPAAAGPWRCWHADASGAVTAGVIRQSPTRESAAAG